LAYVISRLLGGYDYVIAHDQGAIEIVVSGKHGEAPAPIQKPITAPGPQPVAAPGPELATFQLTLEHIRHAWLYFVTRLTARR
jgi:hypothetical protein